MRIFTAHTQKQFFRDYEVYDKEMLTYIMRVSPLRQTKDADDGIPDPAEKITHLKQHRHAYYLEVPVPLLRYYRRGGLWVPSEMYLQPDHTGQVCFYRGRDEFGNREYFSREMNGNEN